MRRRLAAAAALRLRLARRTGARRPAHCRDDMDVDRELVLQDRRQADRGGRLQLAAARKPVGRLAGVSEGQVDVHQGARPASDLGGFMKVRKRRCWARQGLLCCPSDSPLGSQVGHAGVGAHDGSRCGGTLGVPAGNAQGVSCEHPEVSGGEKCEVGEASDTRLAKAQGDSSNPIQHAHEVCRRGWARSPVAWVPLAATVTIGSFAGTGGC